MDAIPKPEFSLLYRALDELLWNDWDPIGVNEIDEARDEYSSYVAQIYDLKVNGSNQDYIAQVLYTIETKRMGLFGDLGRCQLIAQKILDLKS